MMRLTAGRAVFSVGAALACAAAIATAGVGCSHRDHVVVASGTGAVGFALMIRTNVFINSVDYKITGNGIVPIAGSIDVTSTSSARALVTGIPAGTGYALSLTATSTDGKTMCLGMTMFDVAENQTTNATVTMQCKSAGAGTLTIDGTFDNCPILSSVMAMPGTAAVNPPNNTINLQTRATDPENDPLTFQWDQSPLVGAFGNDGVAATTFTCLAAGASTLSITASDGTCSTKVSLTVCCGPAGSCGGGSGGAGGAGTGGAGSGGASSGGASSGGSRTGGAATGGAATGGAGTGGSGTGGARSGGSSSGGASTGGSSAGGSATGGSNAGSGGSVLGGSGTGGAASGGATGGGGVATGGSASGGAATGGNASGGSATGGSATGGSATGGAGTGGAGTGGAGTGGAMACTSPPTHCVSQACEDCTTANCFPPTDGCDLITDAADKALCEAAYACFVAPTHPGTSIPGACLKSGDPTPCWCGTNPTTCLTNPSGPLMANGPCLMEMTLAAHLTAATYDPGTIKLRFVDPAFPLGRAVNLSSCRGSFCSTPPDRGMDECPIPEYVPPAP